VSRLWEKSDLLDAFIMTGPCVQPFLRNETIMLLLPQVAWCLNKTFKGSGVLILAISVVNR
jgi:hypothetical protein